MDLKFKAAFTTPTENSQEEVIAEKSTSQFYCEAPERPDGPAPASPSPGPGAGPVPSPGAESPSSEETKPSDVEEEGSSPLRVCSDVFERMHRELQDKRGADVYERMHRELQERWQAQGGPSGPARPDALPLGEPEGPARPARRARAEREARLLSVPNIKYRERRAPPGAGSLGGLMRRFSKYRVTPLPAHLTSTSSVHQNIASRSPVSPS